jgi:SulP family sulfate permease
VNGLAKLLPAWDWLSEYNTEWLKGDAAAGLTVGVMLIPQSMAYAMLAGVPPIYGLYASLVPLVVYALMGTSRHLAVGTVAIDMLVVSAGVGPLVAAGSDLSYVQLAVLLAAMTGVIELLMGLMRFGFLVNFLSRPVIAGFMTAAPLIIAASQIGNLIGVDLPRSQYVHRMLIEAFEHVGAIDPATLGVGVAGIAVLLALQVWRPKWPGALIWVTVALLASWLVGLEDRGVEVVGTIPAGLPSPEFPEMGYGPVVDLLPTALTLALVQFMSVMSLGKAFEADHDYKVEANRELMAVGAANILGSIFRAISVSGSFSRSAVNERAGANTPMANIVAAALVGVTLLFLTPLFQLLPDAALASIIIVACVGMVDVSELRFLLQTRRVDGALALLTFGCTLGIGIQEGLLIGVGASVVVVLWDLTRAKIHELGHMPGTREFRAMERNPEAEGIPDIHLMRIDARFSFANSEQLQQEVIDEVEGTSVRAVVMDLSGVNSLDTTACGMLEDVVDKLDELGVNLYVAGAKGPIRKVLQKSGLWERIGEERFFLNPHLAVSSILERWGDEEAYDDPRRELEEERDAILRERDALLDEIRGHESEADDIAQEQEALEDQLQQMRHQREQMKDERNKLEEQQEELAEERRRLAEERRRLEAEQEKQDDDEDDT